MITATATLKELHEKTPRTVDAVTVNGAEIKRVLLRSGQKFYRSGIHTYLLDKVVSHVEESLASGAASLGEAVASSPDAVYSDDWVDIGGQMMPRQRLDDLCSAVEGGKVTDFAGLNGALDKIASTYDDDEWVWVKRAVQTVFEVDLDAVDVEGMKKIADDLLTAQGKFLKLILIDAGKEFDDVTRTGFGQDGTADDVGADFVAVRGEYESSKFVAQTQQEVEDLQVRVENFKKKLGV